jgi:hypothetical protein
VRLTFIVSGFYFILTFRINQVHLFLSCLWNFLFWHAQNHKHGSSLLPVDSFFFFLLTMLVGTNTHTPFVGPTSHLEVYVIIICATKWWLYQLIQQTIKHHPIRKCIRSFKGPDWVLAQMLDPTQLAVHQIK